MDRSLKERLIGASVLVGLAVWLIPWVLDGPVTDAEFEVEAELAAERSIPLRTQTIRLDTPQTRSEPVDSAEMAGTPVARNSQAPARPSLEVTAPAAPADTPLEDSGETGLVTLAPAASVESPSSSAVVPAPGWMVQVGSFGEEENARRESNRLTDLGYTTRIYTHTSGGRLMYRVRVGPESSRESADDIASSLAAQGFPNQVVSSD